MVPYSRDRRHGRQYQFCVVLVAQISHLCCIRDSNLLLHPPSFSSPLSAPRWSPPPAHCSPSSPCTAAPASSQPVPSLAAAPATSSSHSHASSFAFSFAVLVCFELLFFPSSSLSNLAGKGALLVINSWVLEHRRCMRLSLRLAPNPVSFWRPFHPSRRHLHCIGS